MMTPSVAQHHSALSPFKGAMQNEMITHRGHFVPQHHSGELAEIPSVAETVAEYRMAQLVFEARIRARARMSDFFRQQKMQEQQLRNRMAALPQQPPVRVQPIRAPQTMRRNSSLSLGSDSSSSVPPRQSVVNLSYNTSLDNSSRSASSLPQSRLYVDTIRDTDVLCGRGGRTNHHPGNKRYRHVISDMKLAYKKEAGKSNKTDLARAIVDHVCAYGGRFIKKEETTGRYYVLTRGEARKKTSQALRENKELKWTK